ncbi:hypothetical protein EMMF5_006050 [Cystobasidiomycetes sp. EMM_F5]
MQRTVLTSTAGCFARSSALRSAQIIGQRRAASTSTADSVKETTAKAADKVKDTADAAANKAKAGADAAVEGASKYAGQASAAGSRILGQVSSTASGLLGSYREPVVHNLAVLREVAKQVYISEKLAPPTDLQAIRHVYEDGYKKASDASWWRSILESGEWKRLAVYAIEAYGIFTIGEMIGRRHVVGYKLDK